jgi:hypothetical protein
MRSDTFIRPNEGERKVYLFEDCGVWNERGQNILLKTIEEGPSYCAFLFCAENASALLQTIRSRCVEVKLGAAETAELPTEQDDAAALCRLMAEGNAASRAAFLVRRETAKIKRDELGALFEASRLLCAHALLALYGAEVPPEEAELAALLGRRLGRAKLSGVISLLDEYRRNCTYNVGAGITLGGFAAALEDTLK